MSIADHPADTLTALNHLGRVRILCGVLEMDEMALKAHAMWEFMLLKTNAV